MNLNNFTIRLIIPICEDDEIINGYYSKQSMPDNFAIRKNILKKSIEYEGDNIDLVITSNNYFTFSPSSILKGNQFVEEYILRELNYLTYKKPLIIGFDLINNRIVFNPYRGISAMVCLITVDDNNQYKYVTHIWECWADKGNCDQSGFIEQNDRRLTDINNNKICLLSCGDILSCCHDSGRNLPDANIYETNIQNWKNNCDIRVLVTQQISRTVFNKLDKNYFKKNNNLEYQLIWPVVNRHAQRLIMFDNDDNIVDESNDPKYMFIDIQI